jgi:BMFP domain-containing protein YqiC
MDTAKKDSHHIFTPRHRMTQPAQKLNKKLASSRPEVAAHVEQILTDTLDLQSSRAVVQEVLDRLDERQAG